MFLPLFRRHAALIKRAFQDVSSEELQKLEGVLKKVGKRAESLAEKKGHFRAWINAATGFVPAHIWRTDSSEIPLKLKISSE